ncbi:MAG: hypothetical protein ABII00_15710 [Elusimicrobiota bacterium]
MKKPFILVALIAFLTLAAAPRPALWAENKPPARRSLMSWFKHWKQALEKSAVEARYRNVRTTAVAAVRGAGQAGADPSKPYWKGTWSDKKAAERMKEREELAEAVSLIIEGKTEGARAKLDAFEKSHPESSFLPDVREGRAKLDELKAEAGASDPGSDEGEAASGEPAEAEAESGADEAKPAE